MSFALFPPAERTVWQRIAAIFASVPARRAGSFSGWIAQGTIRSELMGFEVFSPSCIADQHLDRLRRSIGTGHKYSWQFGALSKQNLRRCVVAFFSTVEF